MLGHRFFTAALTLSAQLVCHFAPLGQGRACGHEPCRELDTPFFLAGQRFPAQLREVVRPEVLTQANILNRPEQEERHRAPQGRRRLRRPRPAGQDRRGSCCEGTAAASSSARPNPAAVRQWATAQGIPVSTRPPAAGSRPTSSHSTRPLRHKSRPTTQDTGGWYYRSRRCAAGRRFSITPPTNWALRH
jgi:hypothetical protein